MSRKSRARARSIRKLAALEKERLAQEMKLQDFGIGGLREAAKAKRQSHEEMVADTRNFYLNRGLISASFKPKRTITVHTSFGKRTKTF